MAERDEQYILATGESAVCRLHLLDRIFGPSTRGLLSNAGLSRGMRVAEIGCGIGLTARWIAAQIGPEGTVVGVDSSPQQLEIARRSATESGAANLSFINGNAYNTGLPRESFDLVFSRFLLCHLEEPARAIDEMRSLLAPGGILACEDHDNGGIFTEPPTHAYKRLVEISDDVNRARGLDSYIGLKLPDLLRRSGFAAPEVRVVQVAVLRGVEKRFWEMTLHEAASAIIDARAATAAELDSICDEMRRIAEDESILLMLARVTQSWATR